MDNRNATHGAATSNSQSPRLAASGGFPGRPRPGGGMGRGPHAAMFAVPVKAKDMKGTLLRLWKYLDAKRGMLIAVFAMVVISSVLSLAGPYLTGVAIDSYIIPGDLKGLALISLLMLGIHLLSSLASWFQSIWMINISQRVVADMRKDLFARMQNLPLRFFDNTPHGELMSRLTNDVDNVSATINSSVVQAFSSLIGIVGTLVIMIWLSPLLTLVSLVVVPLMFFTTKFITKYTREFFKEQQTRLGQLNGYIEEIISGQKAVKLFAQENRAIGRFEEQNLGLKGVGIKAQIFAGLIPPLMNITNNLSFAVLAGVGGFLALKGIITIGVIASFINYSRQFSRPLNELASQYNMILSAIAGAERVFEVMDEEPEPADSPDAITLPEIKGKVDFCDITFSYKEGVPVLKNFDLHVEPGQTIALVGPTGAGKTTIINLLTRFYDIREGSILIDDVDIRSMARDKLRSSLGIVLQDTYLFSGTVRENIRYGRPDATDEEVEAAARLANADQFIRRLPMGYDTVLGEDGAGLSQGQRQLMSIARAILADPAILILDEATSSVDTRTEIQIQEALLNLMRGRTSFVIAHRLSTIRNADLIVVINHGEIVEKGRHEELLARQGFYYNLYMSQFRKAV